MRNPNFPLEYYCIASQLDHMIHRPGAFFGRKEYSFKEVIAYLNGFAVAQNIYSDKNERNYISLVKEELAKKYKFEANIHIVDLFDSICENDSEKVKLLLELFCKIYNYESRFGQNL